MRTKVAIVAGIGIVVLSTASAIASPSERPTDDTASSAEDTQATASPVEATPTERSTPTERPSPTDVPTPTERPTPPPTPTPTERPTPPPTPAPTVNTGNVAFLAFAGHVTDTSPDLIAGMNHVATDASALDVDALQISSVDLWLSLGEEVDWLDQNPPEPCFAPLHAEYKEAIEVLYEALDLVSDGALYYDADLLSAGADLMAEGTVLVDEASGMIESAGATCGV
jgi:hypothetical protein